MNIYLIVSKQDQSIASSYEADEPITHGGPWGDPEQFSHILLPDGMVAECVTVAQDGSVSQDADKFAAYQAERAIQLAVTKGRFAQTLGMQIIAMVYAANEASFASGQLTPALFLSLMSDPTVGEIERLLQNGSLGTALSLIKGSTALGTYFSTDQVSAIEGAIEAALAQLG